MQRFQAPSLPSVMKHDFSHAPTPSVQRSSFDRSCAYKSAFDAGDLIPFYWDEVLPADTYNVKATIIARLATPIYPIMDNLFLDTFWFFVPERLLWSNWRKFMGERRDPDDSIDFLLPQQTVPNGGYDTNSLADYFGIPTGVDGFTVRAAPFRAYNLIWNEWFRDENLQDSLTVNQGDGPDFASTYTVQKRGKRFDYFTSCLPFPQKGDSVSLPLGVSAPVISSGENPIMTTAGNVDRAMGATYGGTNYGVLGLNLGAAQVDGAVTFTDQTGLLADLTDATSATINQLIEAFSIQDLLVKDARGGTRYIEILKTHFGVQSEDGRLQRPEFLGSSSNPLSFYTVPNTTSTGQGDLGAYAIGEINNEGFTKSFTEHGIIIGLVNLRADLTYQQGLLRKWSRQTRYDFYWPSLANLGEQAVLNKEIYIDGSAADEDVFGYQENYAEYRYNPSLVTGIMRSAAAASLDAWHLAQDFASRPTLSSTFITDDPPVDRVIAVQSEPHIIFDSYLKIICARPMPVYSVPSLTNRF